MLLPGFFLWDNLSQRKKRHKHLNLSDSNMENLPRQLLSSMIEQLKLELDDEASFLKESPEFHSLLQRYGEYLGR